MIVIFYRQVEKITQSCQNSKLPRYYLCEALSPFATNFVAWVLNLKLTTGNLHPHNKAAQHFCCAENNTPTAAKVYCSTWQCVSHSLFRVMTEVTFSRSAIWIWISTKCLHILLLPLFNGDVLCIVFTFNSANRKDKQTIHQCKYSSLEQSYT